MVVALAYLACVTIVAVVVICKKYDSLIGVTSLAVGMASGAWGFFWSNQKNVEHVSKNGGTPKEGENG